MWDLVVVRAEEKRNKLIPPETKTVAGWVEQGGHNKANKGRGVRWFEQPFKMTCRSFLGQEWPTPRETEV